MKFCEKDQAWHDVGDRKARSKTSQALREPPPEEQNQESDEGETIAIRKTKAVVQLPVATPVDPSSVDKGDAVQLPQQQQLRTWDSTAPHLLEADPIDLNQEQFLVAGTPLIPIPLADTAYEPSWTAPSMNEQQHQYRIPSMDVHQQRALSALDMLRNMSETAAFPYTNTTSPLQQQRLEVPEADIVAVEPQPEKDGALPAAVAVLHKRERERSGLLLEQKPPAEVAIVQNDDRICIGDPPLPSSITLCPPKRRLHQTEPECRDRSQAARELREQQQQLWVSAPATVSENKANDSNSSESAAPPLMPTGISFGGCGVANSSNTNTDDDMRALSGAFESNTWLRDEKPRASSETLYSVSSANEINGRSLSTSTEAWVLELLEENNTTGNAREAAPPREEAKLFEGINDLIVDVSFSDEAKSDPASIGDDGNDDVISPV